MMLPAKLSEPMIAESRIVIVWSTGSALRRVVDVGRNSRSRDQRRRAAAGAVEERDHLRHRGHLDGARGVDADRRRR